MSRWTIKGSAPTACYSYYHENYNEANSGIENARGLKQHSLFTFLYKLDVIGYHREYWDGSFYEIVIRIVPGGGLSPSKYTNF
jgi:hypothetical protein